MIDGCEISSTLLKAGQDKHRLFDNGAKSAQQNLTAQYFSTSFRESAACFAPLSGMYCRFRTAFRDVICLRLI